MKIGARLTSTSTPSASDLSSDAETDWVAVTAALAACNANRLAGAREIRRLELTLWFSLAALFITALLIAYRNGSVYFATTAFAISCLLLAAIQSVTERQRRRLQGDAYRVLLPSVLSRIDDLVIEFGQASDSIERMPGHYFLPRQKARHDLVVTGRWNGLVFSVSQSQFTRPAGDDRDEITFWESSSAWRSRVCFPAISPLCDELISLDPCCGRRLCPIDCQCSTAKPPNKEANTNSYRRCLTRPRRG